MVEYTCSKCDKTFKQKGHYKAHLNRKFPCVKLINTKQQKSLDKLAPNLVQNKDNIKCEFCNRSFTRKSSLIRHYNRCKIKKDNILVSKINDLNIIIQEQNKNIKDLQEKNKR